MDKGDAYASFAGRVGTTVLVAGGPMLHVVEVTEPQRTGDYRSFAVRFRGPLDMQLPQGMINITDDRAGSDDGEPIFIVPIGRDHTGFTYEAVFNTVIVGAS